MDISIIGQNGWSKKLHVEKTVARIGSTSSSDVFLPTTGQPVQIQLHIDPLKPTTCKLLCLAGTVEVESGGSLQTIEAYHFAILQPFDLIHIAGHTISLDLPTPSSSSTHFSADLILPDPTLQLGRATIGRLRIKNLGEKDNCQFQVLLSGIPKDCYQVDPIPLLYPGSEEEAAIRFFHLGTVPKAGLLPVSLHVRAELSYPGEEAIIEKTLRIAPVFAYDLDLVDDFHKGAQTAREIPPVEALAPPEAARLSSHAFKPEVTKAEQADRSMVPDPEPMMIPELELRQEAVLEPVAKTAEPIKTMPAEVMPADTKPAETMPAEIMRAENMPADTKPVDTEPADTEPEPIEKPNEKTVAKPMEQPKAKVYSNTNSEFWNEEER